FHADDPRKIALLHLQAPAPRPSGRAPVSPAVDAVVLRCLEKHADKRFASVNELVAALRAATGEAPSADDERTLQALGVYVELHALEEHMDDALFEDIANVLDTVEHGLTNGDYAFPLRTSNALLAVRVLEASADPAREREAAFDTVSALRGILAERADPHPHLELRFSLKLGEVRCNATAAGTEIVGGPLLDVSGWSDAERVPAA
ncbi:MAG: hypothetical protein RL701_6767, partial [Pseudomonadota bacterium]